MVPECKVDFFYADPKTVGVLVGGSTAVQVVSEYPAFMHVELSLQQSHSVTGMLGLISPHMTAFLKLG